VRRIWISWSSGKDSAWALHELRRSPDVEVVGLLTTVTADYDRISMHGVRRELLMRQAEAVGLEVYVVEIPAPCPNAVYAAKMSAALDQARSRGVTGIAFGDLFLEDVRAYREAMLEPTGIAPLFPLWGRPTTALADEMIAAGLRAVVTCADPKQVDPALCGRAFDRALLDALPAAADPCAENGEFHTFAWDGPMFDAPVAIEVGQTVLRDGFVFTDVSPARGPAA
jgi:uncharacterized protein (TIGR00290 family)